MPSYYLTYVYYGNLMARLKPTQSIESEEEYESR